MAQEPGKVRGVLYSGPPPGLYLCFVQGDAAQNSNLRNSFSLQEDEERHITLEQFREMANLPMNVEIERKFLPLENRTLTGVGREEYAGLRDHLIMKLLCRSGQRPGALANLTIEEFKNGQWDERSDSPLFVTQTQVHKTSATEGAATLFWNKRNYKLGEIYLKKLRPIVVSGEKGKFAPVPGVSKDREGFFLNHSGQVMSRRQIYHTSDRIGSKSLPQREPLLPCLPAAKAHRYKPPWSRESFSFGSGPREPDVTQYTDGREALSC